MWAVVLMFGRLTAYEWLTYTYDDFFRRRACLFWSGASRYNRLSGCSLHIHRSGFNLVHLLSMSLFLGALLMVDLRLLGAVLTRRPLAEVAARSPPVASGGVPGLAITGVPAWMATAETQYFNPCLPHEDVGPSGSHDVYVYPAPEGASGG